MALFVLFLFDLTGANHESVEPMTYSHIPRSFFYNHSFCKTPQFGPAQEPWKAGEPKINKFVFIGKGLNRAELTKGLMDCLYKEDEGEQHNGDK